MSVSGYHFQSDQGDAHEVFPGAHGRFVHGDQITIAKWVLDEGTLIPEHQHGHEQVVNVLSGAFIMQVAGQKYRLGPGDTLMIPSNASHSGEALSRVECLDVFTPVREDYRDRG